MKVPKARDVRHAGLGLRQGTTMTLRRISCPEVHTPIKLIKLYLAAMGISGPPRLVIPKEIGLSVDDVYGAAMMALYPGHARCFIRHIPTPGFLCDIRSEYPAVCALMGIWSWWTADHVVVRDATGIPALLQAVTPEQCLHPDPWQGLNVLCQIQPQGDWLPVRLTRPGESEEGEIVLDGPLTVPEHLGPVWYTLPDLLDLRWRTGRRPRILRALQFVPVGTRRGLRPVLFGGEVQLDPGEDLFVALVELRHRFTCEGKPHLAQAAKVAVNALTWGIAAELHPAGARRVTVYDGVRRFHTLADPYEELGPYYCPPIAALVTGGGRLLLYLLAHLLREP